MASMTVTPGDALEEHHDHRARPKPGDWQRSGGKNPRLDPGQAGPENRRRRMLDGRRFLPERGLPAKQNVIYSAKAISLVHPSKGLGVVNGSMRVDMAGVARRKRQMVDGLVERHLANFRA